MNTFTTRTNDKFTYSTIIFATKEEAKKNCDELRQEFASRAFKSIHGHDGFMVSVSTNEYKEFNRETL